MIQKLVIILDEILNILILMTKLDILKPLQALGDSKIRFVNIDFRKGKVAEWENVKLKNHGLNNN